MEGILYQRMSPLLKCVVLFLFIFTAKVLTTRPQEAQDGKNSIQHLKTNHFVRTFTKYHHRRSIQWNQDYWPSDDQPKVIQKRNAEPISSYKKRTKRIVKRNVDIPNSNEFIDSGKRKYPLSLSESLRDNFEKTAISINDNDNSVLNKLDKNKFKVKPAFIPTSAPIVHKGSTITCLYKTNRISYSSTPSYDDDKNSQTVVENESFDVGRVSVETLPNGETNQVERCTDPRAYCYTLWHQDGDGNVTVLGQGCWRSAARAGPGGCDRCTLTPRLPATKFCCCTSSYCNTRFLNIADEPVELAAQSTLAPPTAGAAYGGAAVSAALALLVLLAVAALWHRGRCTARGPPHRGSEKDDVMGSGPDSLATGLLCVDNLTLSEHIGSGKFGSVWRGSLGGALVAVKLHASAATWRKEANIYTTPHLQHPNILRYYGSDTRATLDGGREHLLVLELCTETLRSKLTRDTLTWAEFAGLAHGLASALAHLHTPVGSKPCVVHRDVNSSNVLVAGGHARLADLGLAQCVPPPGPPGPPGPPVTINEAGTLRYLAPEALEGALDLSEARAALCAVDVFALALVTWEMLWRTSGAHNGVTPPYAAPYSHHGLPSAPTLAQMQSLVSRNKARPPLPSGGSDSRALRIASDTCDECWDHDAEARLTAVCVEERMSELKLLLRAHPPLARPNNLNNDSGTAPESDKNSNVTSSQPPLPPPPLPSLPSLGRNACAQRNTHTCTEQEHTLVHRSLKDTPEVMEAPPTRLDNCLSVARDENRIRTFAYENSDRMNEIRSYPRPIEFVPNDVTATERRTKRTNLLREERHKWGIRRFFEKRLGKSRLETEVKLIPEKQERNGRIQTCIVERERDRPSNLVLDQERNYHFEPCTLSPPNRTLSPTMLMESQMNRESRVFGFKELPSADEKQNQIFAVIVPKAKPHDYSLIELQTAGSSDSTAHIKSALEPSDDSNKRTQHSGALTSSGRSSRASINLELQYLDQGHLDSPFDINSDCSSSEDEQLMLLSEDGGSKITMQAIPKPDDKKKYQHDVLKESHKTENYNFQNKYKNFDNEYSDPADKENLVNGYSGDNPVYIAALNGEISSADLKLLNENEARQNKPPVKSLTIKRQHSLEQVSEIFTSSGDVALLNPAGRVKTPGDLPAAVRRARSNRQHQRRGDSNRLSLYDDRMMFGNSL